MSAILSTLANSSSLIALRQAVERYFAYAQTRPRFEMALASFGLLLLGTMLKYHDRAIGTRARRDIPGDRGAPLVGNLFQIWRFKDDVLTFYLQQVKKHGKVFTFTMPGIGRVIQITSPELIEYVQKGNFDNYSKSDPGGVSTDLFGHGIFVSNGAEWRMQRKTASNVFTTRLFRDLVQSAFKEAAHELGDNLVKFERRSTDNDPCYFDLQQEFAKMTLDAFGKVSFGIEFNSMSDEGNNDFGQAFDFMTRRIEMRAVEPFWRISEWIIPSLRRKIRQSLDTINQAAYKAIAKRRIESPEDKEVRRRDLLDYFIDHEYEDGSRLTDVELRDIFLNFMIAGRDTTAQSLAWMFYHLKKHPKIEAKMREEIDVIYPQGSDDYTYDEIAHNLPYVKAVFYETLRLTPAVSLSGVFAIGADILPDGTRIDAGDAIGFSSYCMARETDVWGPNAAEFYPERWLTDDKSGKSPFGKFKNENSFKFNSFNGGPRICLGQQFATIEAMVTAVYLLQNFQFELKPNHPVAFPLPALTSPIAGGLHVRVLKRRDN
ncbi:cytochrome P450 [Mortierella sp. GBAus27b]|nr:cytochrome P450 [Mortierella sp. GBAus27b]